MSLGASDKGTEKGSGEAPVTWTVYDPHGLAARCFAFVEEELQPPGVFPSWTTASSDGRSLPSTGSSLSRTVSFRSDSAAPVLERVGSGSSILTSGPVYTVNLEHAALQPTSSATPVWVSMGRVPEGQARMAPPSDLPPRCPVAAKARGTESPAPDE